MSEFVIMPKEHYEGACNAIREKMGNSNLILSGDMENKIRSIETGIDTSDANVTPGDLAKDVISYGADGNKVIGTLPEGAPSISDGTATCVDGTTIKNGQEYRIPATGTYVSYVAPATRVLYSTATITNGKIVLSNPLNVNGSSATEQKSNYTTYKYFYGDLKDGSSDSEVYRYSSISSSTSSVTGGTLTSWNYIWYHQYIDKSIYLTSTNKSDVIVRNGTSVQIHDDITNFGNVEPSYVAEGRTFTSSSGLKLTGTGSQLLKIKTGTNSTAGATSISTGLYKIERFILHSTSVSVTSVGLMEAVCLSGGSCYYTYCSSYTSSSNYTLKYENDSSLMSIDGGTVMLNGTGAKAIKASTAWIAIGY